MILRSYSGGPLIHRTTSCQSTVLVLPWLADAQVRLDATESTYYRCPASPWRALVLRLTDDLRYPRCPHLNTHRERSLQAGGRPEMMTRKERGGLLQQITKDLEGASPQPHLLQTTVLLRPVPALSLTMTLSLGMSTMPMMTSPLTPLPPLRARVRLTGPESAGATTRLSTTHARALQEIAAFTNAGAWSEACRGRTSCHLRFPHEHPVLASSRSRLMRRPRTAPGLWCNLLCPVQPLWKLSSNRIKG